jgi:hypothetical protein
MKHGEASRKMKYKQQTKISARKLLEKLKTEEL